jgi:hypothetical protein
MVLADHRNEAYRLRRLKAIGILDSPAEAHFDAITKTAAQLLRTPIALLNFIDDAREWCKSLGHGTHVRKARTVDMR